MVKRSGIAGRMIGSLMGRTAARLAVAPVLIALVLGLAAISLATPAVAQAAGCTDITYIGAAAPASWPRGNTRAPTATWDPKSMTWRLSWKLGWGRADFR